MPLVEQTKTPNKKSTSPFRQQWRYPWGDFQWSVSILIIFFAPYPVQNMAFDIK